MCCDARSKWSGEFGDFSTGVQEIDCLSAGEMSAFEHDRHAVLISKSMRRFFHCLSILDFFAEEFGRFIQIWGNECGERKQMFFVGTDRSRLEKRIAAGSRDDGIDYQWARASSFDHLGDCSDNLHGVEEPSLNRGDGKISSEHIDLVAHHLRADWFNARDFTGDFRNDAGFSGQSINAQGRKSFEIGLNAGAGAAIGSRDGQGDWRLADSW